MSDRLTPEREALLRGAIERGGVPAAWDAHRWFVGLLATLDAERAAAPSPDLAALRGYAPYLAHQFAIKYGLREGLDYDPAMRLEAALTTFLEAALSAPAQPDAEYPAPVAGAPRPADLLANVREDTRS